MKKISFLLIMVCVLVLSACGVNYEKQLAATWYREGSSSIAFV